MMTWRAFLILHLLAAALGTAALWWFFLPKQPEMAVADGSTAAAVAGYIEILVMRKYG